ncbi:MAG: single-stranded-DNA-specific exonuclease RecJ [Candidatus Glassbacteria bacterium]
MKQGIYRWIEPVRVDEKLRESLSKDLGISSVLTEILMRRGYVDARGIRDFIYPHQSSMNDPFLMRGMDAASDRLLKAVRGNEAVLIHGDYDVDGLTSVALLEKVLVRLGLRVHHYIPNRLSEGYGVSAEGIRRAKEVGAALIVTVDCGIVAYDEINLARSMNLDVIVTDHHEPGPVLPDAVAVLNPKQSDCPYPDKELAGIGVAFKLCQALYQNLGRDEEELNDLLDMVALGTIADVAPMVGENRVLVSRGLEVLHTNPNAALRALLRTSGLSGKHLTAGHVAFSLAPRINAVGRMGDSQEVVEFLTTDKPREAERMAAILEQENRKRQRIDSKVLVEAREKLADFNPDEEWAVVLTSHGWHQGVLGIVASRLVEQYYRPVVLVTLDEDGIGRGSARSIPSFHLYDALRACADHLIEYGGHQHAAGIKIRQEDVEEFRKQLNLQAKKALTPSSLQRELRIDAEVSMDEVNRDLYHEMKLTAPNGPSNPRPLLLMRGVKIDGYPRNVGEGHLKMKVRGKGRTLDAIGFGLGELAEELSLSNEPLDMVFSVEENTWKGITSLQAKVKDIRIGYADKNNSR